MNITSPIMAGAARVADLPGDSVTSFLRMIGAGTGLFDDSVDGGLGLVMSALSGVATALAVAILFSMPASPSHSEAFGPWHLADGIVPAQGDTVTTETHDAFAIRYRVL
jgi:hypothetical protein